MYKRHHILVLVAAFAFLGPAVRSEQPLKSLRLAAQDDRIKALEDRADAAEKAAAAAAMEKDYINRTQKLYESYYQKTVNTQLWTLGIVGLLFAGVFWLAVRFSLNMFEQRTKLATTDATTQLRNDHGRILSKEIQKLWDSNTADTRKLKETLTAQIAELEQNLKDRSDFQVHFVQGLADATEKRCDDAVSVFRQALTAYKSSKPRNAIETKFGGTVIRYIFESLRETHAEGYLEKAKEELADSRYNDLKDELALAALQSPWLGPLINERNPTPPEPPAPAPILEVRPAAAVPARLPDSDLTFGEDFDSSCRLIES
jgi:hypothetical protein